MVATASMIALLLAAVVQSEPRHEVRALVRAADAAVVADGAAALARLWQARLRADPHDRLAALVLATIARLTYRNERAAELYATALGDPGAPPDAVAAYAWVGRALVLRGAAIDGATDSAFVRAIEAARAIGDRALGVEARVYLANIRARSRGVAEAERLFAEARALIPASDARSAALLHCGRAEMLLLTGDPETIAVATEGAELAGQAGDFRLRAVCLTAIAGTLARRDPLDSALVVYGDAIRDFRRARHLPGLAVALQWRGYLFRTIGMFAEARRDLEEAVALGAASGAHSPEAWALGNLASLHTDMGDIATAAAYAERAIALFARRGDRYGEQYARSLRGTLQMAAGNLEAARREHREGLRIAQEASFPGGLIGHRVVLAHLAMRTDDWDGARRELEAALESAREFDMPGFADGLQYHVAALALREGRPAEAIPILRAGLEKTPARQGDWAYWYGARLAEAHARLGNIAAAEAQLAAAADALDAWRATLDDSRLRVLAFQRGEDYSDPDLGVATVIAALAANGRAASAFELAERRRARGLLDRLVRAEAMLEGSTLETDSPASGGARAPAAEESDTAAWRRVAAAIADDRTALLEFVTGEGGEPTTLFVVTRSAIRAHLLPPADSLRDAAARLVALLESGESPRPLARALHDAILEPALAALPPGTDRLVVVPSGPFHGFPFDALPGADGSYAVERFQFSFVPSAAVAVRLWRRGPAAPAARAILAFADPQLVAEDDGRGTVRAATAASLARLPRLRASAREASAVARFAPAATVLAREDARESWLKQTALAPFRVLHFATHALVDDAVLAHTGLALAPGDGEDGFVTPGELARLRLNADLVVLAACRTARGVAVRGEGIRGLTTSFFEAGARAVVASRWDVADEASARMMEDFYRAMAEGAPAGAALRAAKLAALREGRPIRDWAAYAVFGDPFARPPLRPPAGWTWLRASGLIGGMALALLAAATIVGMVRRARRAEAGQRGARHPNDQETGPVAAAPRSPRERARPRIPAGTRLPPYGKAPRLRAEPTAIGEDGLDPPEVVDAEREVR